MTTKPLTERVFLFHFPLFPIFHILLFGGRDQEESKSGRKILRAALYKNLQAERSGALSLSIPVAKEYTVQDLQETASIVEYHPRA